MTPVIDRLTDGWRRFWALSWRWKGAALGSATAALTAVTVGAAILVNAGDGDGPAALAPGAVTPTATTGLRSTPTPTPTAAASPQPTAGPATATATAPPAGRPAVAAPTPTPKPAPPPAPAPTATPAPAGPVAVLVGAGDIAFSGSGDEATAKLLDGISGTVFTTGDNAYEDGSDQDFAKYYNPTWGRHKARTRPAPGNHDYHTSGASGYFKYFGAAAGTAGKGYYSYNVGAWHVVVLNSNCSDVGGCNAGSPQEKWLRADLAGNPKKCTAAYWHHPLYSSGSAHGSDSRTRALYQALYDANADLIITGHEHNYERFKPQDANGNFNAARGIRQFVVGTGGKSHYSFGSAIANSEVRNSGTYGVIKLTLNPTSYDWRFVPEAGKTFTDAGSQACH